MAKAVPTSRSGMAFVTTATHERRPIFEISRVADLFIETLLHYRTHGYYKLHGYLVMPDHIYLLMTPQSIRLEQAVRLIKQGFVHRLSTRLPIWETGYKGYSIANQRDLNTVREYLYHLPVRAKLTPRAELYPYSSAYRKQPAAS
jgi:putative transposase